jgi:hypothetical protein
MRKYLILTVAVALLMMWGSSVFGLSNTLTIPIYTRSGLPISFDLDVEEYVGNVVTTGRSGTPTR